MIHPTDEQTLIHLKKKIDTCPKCRGTDLKCTCYAEYYLAFRIITAHIPLKYRNFTLEDITVPSSQKNVDRIHKYIDHLDKYRRKGIGLYLYGNPGTAKSVLGCVVLIEALRKGYSSYFLTMDQYRSAVLEKEYDLLDLIKTVDFLLIDDVGREFHDSKGLLDSFLDELTRVRSDNLLPTLMTTNQTDTFTFRLGSILKEHYISIPFNTDDYRKNIQAKIKKEEN